MKDSDARGWGEVIELETGHPEPEQVERSIEAEFLHTVRLYLGQLIDGELNFETRGTLLREVRLFHERMRQQLEFAQRLGYKVQFTPPRRNENPHETLRASLVDLRSHETLVALAAHHYGGQRLMLISSAGLSPGETFDPRIQTIFLTGLHQESFGQWKLGASVYDDLERGEDGEFYGTEKKIRILHKAGQPWAMNSGIRRPRGILLVREGGGGGGGLDPKWLEEVPERVRRAA